MMNIKPEYLAKLKEEQDKGYQKCMETITKWTKFRDDYLELKNRLDTLADKTEYDVMVPFSTVAFMPGKLVHTNEIMVLLGDNWFVERSAKQASEIVGRRLAQCDSSLEQLYQECKQFEKWKECTSEVQKEIDEFVDINEVCTEDEDRTWREKHRQNVRKHFEDRKRNGTPDVGKSGRERGMTQEEYLKLQEAHGNAELDREDLSNSEIDEESETSSVSSENEFTEVSINKGKRVHWKEDALETHHTNERKETLDLTLPGETQAVSTVPVIQSPADIYKQFAGPSPSMPPKSILKPSENINTVAVPNSAEANSIVGVPKFSEQQDSKAFSGVIVERRLPESSITLEDATSSKKISKFKAQRLAKKT